MNSRYLLPVCFALAAHGALLFGFTKHPRSAKPPEDEFILTPFHLRNVEEDIPTVAPAEGDEPAPTSAPDVPPPPRNPEPLLVVEVGNQPRMELPPITRLDRTDMREIPLVGPGVMGERGDMPWGTDILSLDRLDNTPRTRFQAAPVYPFRARRDGIRGEVQVEFVVDESGRVIDPRIIGSSDRMFEEPTLRAVARWQFEPGRRHGKVVKFRMRVPVMFNLNEGW
jgi:protein TonB